MMKFTTTRLTILALATLMLIAVSASAQHAVFLRIPNAIPSYCQESGIWCGAATAQMALEGYPLGVNHPFAQAHIWNRIQFHKNDAGVNWATDPDGLQQALMELGGDPGVHWVIFANPDPHALMHTIGYWMTQRLFPVPVLVYGFQHWILVTGVMTDADPTHNSSVTLMFIEVTDPWDPPCPTATAGGVTSFMSGWTWYSNYWYSPGIIPASKWHGNFVAVVEPPEREGVAIARDEQPAEGQVISPGEAIELAMRWLQKLNIFEREPYTILRHARPLEPFPVNTEARGYYVVPLGYEEAGLSQGAVLVNAYNGDFQEVGVFEQPVSYLDRDEATRIALKYLCSCEEDVRQAHAELVFEPSAQTQSRFLPLWRVSTSRGTLFVTQEGKVFRKLTKLPLGD